MDPKFERFAWQSSGAEKRAFWDCRSAGLTRRVDGGDDGLVLSAPPLKQRQRLMS